MRAARLNARLARFRFKLHDYLVAQSIDFTRYGAI
jgi:hypothetical protein